MIGTLVLTLRGAAAILVLTTLVGALPRVVQLGTSAAVGVWAALLAGGAAPDAPLGLVAARELAVGATLGILAAVPLLAAAMAGRLVDAAASARRGPYAPLFAILAAAVFVGIDGHVAVVTGVVDSFHAVPAIAHIEPRVVDGLGGLVPAAVTLAVPWLVTAAVVEIAVGAGLRLAARAGVHAPVATAVPAALVMITATLIASLAVAIAALVRTAA